MNIQRLGEILLLKELDLDTLPIKAPKYENFVKALNPLKLKHGECRKIYLKIKLGIKSVQKEA